MELLLLFLQDMVLGLYYLTKGRKGVKGEGYTYYSPEEVIIANNEGQLIFMLI